MAEANRRVERRLGLPLLAMGAALSFFAALDPGRLSLLWGAIPLALVGGALGRRAAWAPWAAATVVVVGAGACVQSYFGADSLPYYSWLRSAAFDGDWDFANEWREFGHDPAPPVPATGKPVNVFSVGPALLWSPFVLAAHGYLEAGLGTRPWPADGFSAPYLNATAAGTRALAVAGAFLLASALARRHGGRLAWLAVLGVVLASPLLHYLTRAPSMSHGVEFAAAAALFFAIERVGSRPAASSWAMVGAALGLLTLVRWQGLVYLLLVGPLAIAQLLSRRARPSWVALGALASVLVFSPQMLAWRSVFGSAVLIPQGGGFMDWSSPHLVDVLFSANHGLFTWSPLLLPGLIALILAAPGQPLAHGCALLVFGATAWVNGGVADWAGSDAFGARRFVLTLPLLASGLALAGAALARLVARRPLLAPAALAALAVLWNVGFVVIQGRRLYPEAAPLERLAGDQARELRRALEAAAGALLGPAARGFVYKSLSAEYIFTEFNRNGIFDPARLDERDLRGAWSPPRRKSGTPPFRFVVGPEGCVRLPVETPFDLEASVSVRAAPGPPSRQLSLRLNGSEVSRAPVGPDWETLRVGLPAQALSPGENWLCFAFSATPSTPGDEARGAVSQVLIRPWQRPGR